MKRATFQGTGLLFALLAAMLYALNAPLSKYILQYLPPTLTAGLLYLGAGLGMALVGLFRKKPRSENGEKPLTRSDIPFVLAMILLDIAAPVLLMFGLKYTSASGVALLNNFEIVATALLAFCFFRERINGTLWLGIFFVTLSCFLLSFDPKDGFSFSFGSALVLGACACWGLENNCTRRLSEKDPLQIVVLKGVFSGLGSLALGLCIGERFQTLPVVFCALALGFVAYGLSIFYYVHAQRRLGAAKTSAYYAVAPFISALLSLILFRELPTVRYYVAFACMIVGVVFTTKAETPTEKD